MLQDREAAGPGNHQIDHRTNRRILAQSDGSFTGIGKLGLEACLFEMIGNNPLDRIICLGQQNLIITLRVAHNLNWPCACLTVN